MSAHIQLTLAGKSPRQQFVFSEPQTCMIGRSPDCAIALPATVDYCDVSRRHCALKVDPPFVHVRDLGSLNGTFVNNERIDGRAEGRRVEVADEDAEWVTLRDGDELRLGQNATLVLEVREFVAEEPSKDGVGSGTYNVCPD